MGVLMYGNTWYPKMHSQMVSGVLAAAQAAFGIGLQILTPLCSINEHSHFAENRNEIVYPDTFH